MTVYEALYSGDYIINGNYQLVMQSDGNLVFYRLANGVATEVCWEAHTHIPGSRAVFDGLGYGIDGPALIVYDPSNNVRAELLDYNGGTVHIDPGNGTLWVGEHQIAPACS